MALESGCFPRPTSVLSLSTRPLLVVIPGVRWTFGPPKEMKNAASSGNCPPFTTTLSSLSFRAQRESAVRHSGAPNLKVYNHLSFVTLSEAHSRLSQTEAFIARSRRTLGDACWQMLLRAFQPQTTRLKFPVT
jgi:hypothetical protein